MSKGNRKPQLPPHMQNGMQVPMNVPILGNGQHQRAPHTTIEGVSSPDQIEPMHDAVVVRKIDFTQKYGSFVIPGMGDDAIFCGEVLSVGPGRWSDVMEWLPPVNLEPGDIIIMAGAGMAPLRVHCGTDEVFVFRARDIMLRLTKKAVKEIEEKAKLALEAGDAVPPSPLVLD